MQKLLVLQHVAHETPGRFLEIAKLLGVEMEIIRLWEGYAEKNPQDYSGLLIMGGPQSAYAVPEKYPSKNFEIKTVREFVEAGKPVLGVCLGSQLIAKTFAGKVYKNVVEGKHIKETGYVTVSLTSEGKKDRLFKGFPNRFEVFQWHGDVFDVPRGGKLLVEGEVVKNQGFAYGSAHALLFHFEFTLQMVEELVKLDREWMNKDNSADEKAIAEEAIKLEQEQQRLCELLFKNWLGL